MEDARLYEWRRDPSPEFAERLRGALRAHEPIDQTTDQRWPLAKIAASIAIVAAIAGLLSVPAVRASAASFLAMFREINFVGVRVSDRSITRLDGLDGQVVTVRVSPIVSVTYRTEQRSAQLLQTRTPQVDVPASVNLKELGEIGLRLLGMPPVEANRFAQTIDWTTTLLVPIPPNAQYFQQIQIGGHPGLSVEMGGGKTRTQLLLWSGEGRVFALEGNIDARDMLLMANSIR
jgi:hypothetical protein